MEVAAFLALMKSSRFSAVTLPSVIPSEPIHRTYSTLFPTSVSYNSETLAALDYESELQRGHLGDI